MIASARDIHQQNLEELRHTLQVLEKDLQRGVTVADSIRELIKVEEEYIAKLDRQKEVG
jgi:hypothetical protein